MQKTAWIQQITPILQSNGLAYKINTSSVDIAIIGCKDLIFQHTHLCGHIRIIYENNVFVFEMMVGYVPLAVSHVFNALIMGGVVLGGYYVFATTSNLIFLLLTIGVAVNAFCFDLNLHRKMKSVITDLKQLIDQEKIVLT